MVKSLLAMKKRTVGSFLPGARKDSHWLPRSRRVQRTGLCLFFNAFGLVRSNTLLIIAVSLVYLWSTKVVWVWSFCAMIVFANQSHVCRHREREKNHEKGCNGKISKRGCFETIKKASKDMQDQGYNDGWPSTAGQNNQNITRKMQLQTTPELTRQALDLTGRGGATATKPGKNSVAGRQEVDERKQEQKTIKRYKSCFLQEKGRQSLHLVQPGLSSSRRRWGLQAV